MITIARASRLFGVDGEMMINLHSTFPTDFNIEEPLFVKINSLLVPLYCDKFERRGRSSAQVRFADFDTDRRASELLGLDIMVHEADDEGHDPDDEEFFMEDLIGFSAIIGEMRGEVCDYYDSEYNPLFGVLLNEREQLIPAAEEFIAAIDFEARSIEFTLPEGLLEL